MMVPLPYPPRKAKALCRCRTSPTLLGHLFVLSALRVHEAEEFSFPPFYTRLTTTLLSQGSWPRSLWLEYNPVRGHLQDTRTSPTQLQAGSIHPPRTGAKQRKAVNSRVKGGVGRDTRNHGSPPNLTLSTEPFPQQHFYLHKK